MALSTEAVRDRLLDECADQRKRLRFLHEHGKHMTEGIRAAEEAISAVALDDDTERWLARVVRELQALASHLSLHPKDEDGWLVAGMRVIVTRAAEEHWESVRLRVAAALEACFPDRAASLMSALYSDDRALKAELLTAARRALADREPDRTEAFLAQLERRL